MMAAKGQSTSASIIIDVALDWHICVHTVGEGLAALW